MAEIKRKKISFDGITTVWQLYINCERCGAEYAAGNVYVARYCPACAEIVKREQIRLRVKKCREKKRLRENGYDA